jgi:RHS repeat-associated protein
VSQIVFAANGSTRMTTTKQSDDLNRLTQISAQPSGAALLPDTYSYHYNAANQRTQSTFSDGSHWVYQYDALGQVTNGARFWSDGTHVAGEQYQYQFDTIGNRTQTQTGGDASGLNLRVANYAANTLNQLTQRDVSGTSDVIGAALVGNPVTINGVTAADRKAEYFHGTVSANNTSSAAWVNVSATGAGSTVAGNIYVAQEPEQFHYDLDGNLTSDGRWTYTWDAENRLIGMTVNTSAGPQYQLTFAYDSKCRRIQKTVANNGVSSTPTFLYDGWNLIAELGANNAPIRNYVWGTDLSGSQQGAGGVGGLLEVTYHGTATTNAFVAYDGNGNVSALVNAGDGTLLAGYEYGPFGEVIRNSGPLAKNNPFRFSTKYQDDESDLIYYGLRYLKTSTGGWLSRDPLNAVTGTEARYELLEDDGFDDDIAQSIAASPVDLNDYIFAHNQPVVDYDLFGLCVSLPDSGSGSVNGSDPIHIGLHKWGKHHHLPPGWGGSATITFKVCCPATVQYLKTWGETALQTVVGTPPPTLNGNTFPYSVQSGPSGSGPCYTIVLEVPSTTATEYWTGTSSYANFLSTIRIVGQCCCSSSGPPTQNNPPPLPPLPPPPRHGSGL